MPLTREQKAAVIDELKDKLSRKKIAVFVSFKEVDVKTSFTLRKNLKEVAGEYKVAKKTLVQKILTEMGVSLPDEALAGQLGLAFDYDSETNVAKAINQMTKKSKFTILGGLMENSYLSAAQVQELALLPDIDTMRARTVGVIQSPLTGLARTLQGVQLGFINVLRAIASKNS